MRGIKFKKTIQLQICHFHWFWKTSKFFECVKIWGIFIPLVFYCKFAIVQKKNLRKFFSKKSLVSYPFLELRWKFVSMVVKTAFYVSRGTILGPKFKKLTSFYIIFGLLAESFRGSREKCILRVQTNNLRKFVFDKTIIFSMILGLWAKNFRTFD